MARIEDSHQKAYMQWFETQYPGLVQDIHHFANERKCTPQYGKHLKQMGVKRGVADIFLAIPSNGKAGLWIELKVGNGRLTKEQREFLARKSARGYMALAVWGWEAAKEVTCSYLEELA